MPILKDIHKVSRILRNFVKNFFKIPITSEFPDGKIIF